MGDTGVLEILKKALLLEKRGKAFYEKVANNTENNGVKELFTTMAKEEESHIQIISDQFKSYRDSNTITFEKSEEAHQSHFASMVLNESIKKEISAAEFEAAAIAAAMAMEKNAIALYLGRAKETTDPQEKELYSWLAKWEQSHLDFLVSIDKELCEQIWQDNQFWPF